MEIPCYLFRIPPFKIENSIFRIEKAPSELRIPPYDIEIPCFLLRIPP